MNMHEPTQGTITLRLPSTLSAYSGGKSQVLLEATTLGNLLAALACHYPQIWEHLCTADGCMQSHVKIFVNNVLVTSASDMNIPLNPGQEVIVLPSSSILQ